MSRYTVDLAELDALVERMAAVSSQLAAVHDDVESRMQRLRVVWTGRAALEHERAYAQWTAGADEVGEALQRLRQIATIAHRNYASAVSTNAAMWSR